MRGVVVVFLGIAIIGRGLIYIVLYLKEVFMLQRIWSGVMSLAVGGLSDMK
jgi:hypothetical protein